MLFIATLVLAAVFGPALSYDSTSDFTQCYRNDPELNQCLRNALEEARPFVKTGHSGLKVPRLDPLVIPHLSLEQHTELLDFKMFVSNLTITGASSFKVDEIDYDPKTLKFHIKVNAGPVHADADCTFDGRVLAATLNGQGVLKLASHLVIGTLDIEGELIKIGGIEYYQAKNVDVNFKVADGTAQFEGFENVKPLFLRAINRMMTDNFQALTQDVLSVAKTMINRTAKLIINMYARHTAYDKLLPLK